MKTILVPIDFSKVTDRLVAEAVELSHSTNGRLVLLHVIEPAVGIIDYAVVTMTIAQANKAIIKSARAWLAALAEHLKDLNVPVETRHVLGSPVEEILAEAEKIQADYVVIGSHGHGMIYDVLVGSTTRGVLRHAPCPVLVVPPNIPLRAAAAALAETAVTI